MKVLVADGISNAGVDYLEKQQGIEAADRRGLDRDEFLREIRDAGGLIVRSRTKVDAEALGTAESLKVVGRAGAGVDNIDLARATQKGVLVMNTPGGNSVSAGEHAFALMISLARKIPAADASLRGGEWNKSKFMGRELQYKTLGVAGLGKIGSVVARRALGFQMKVLGYDPFVTEKYAADLGVELVSLEEILGQSDFLSLHLPLNDQTRGVICKSTIDLMKDDAILINAARGGVVLEEDLADALDEGRLGGAALDVFEKEPTVNPRLQQSPKVILTPHIAGSTVEAQDKVGMDIARQVANYLTDEIIVNAVNFPSISPRDLDSLAPYITLGEKLGSLIGQISTARIEEIGIRYYGGLTQLDYRPISNYILKAILRPILSEAINEVNAYSYAEERGISVVETVSSRQRGHSNLISLQLRSPSGMDWVEGAILHEGRIWLISVDGIPVETRLGENLLVVRNDDRPGVIGQVGTVLGENQINIASFVLGKDESHSYALGIVNTDSEIQEEVLEQIREIPAVQSAQTVVL
jgi:D-3-phosphoglycerate dehydrogenase